jgi:CHAT domain-containing protein
MGNQEKQPLSDVTDHLLPEDLSLWLNRTVTAEEEGPILEHLTQCVDCRDQLVMIREATQPDMALQTSPEFLRLTRLGEQVAQEVWSQGQKQTPSISQPAKPAPWWREWPKFLRPAIGWAVAAVLLTTVMIPVYRYYRGPQPAERALASLRQVWTQSRPMEARVTGGFQYLPYRVTRGGNKATPVNQDQLDAATAELAREVADRPGPDARHALGRLYILKGEYEKAEQQLQAAVQANPSDALTRVDLAALFYERGMAEQSTETLFKARAESQQAIALSPKSPEAWFNLALICEGLLLPTEAASAWEKYLEIDPTSGWAEEARNRLQKRRASAGPSASDPDSIADQLLSAAVAGRETELQRLFSERFSEVAQILTDRWPDEYLAACSAGDQSKVEQYQRSMLQVAERINVEKGERFFADSFHYLVGAGKTTQTRVSAVRGLLKEGRASFRGGRLDQSIALFLQARKEADQIGDLCHSELALSGLALAINSQQIETPETLRLRQRLLAETASRSHRQLHAKALIAATNHYLARQMFYSALEASQQAYEIAAQLGDQPTVANALRFIGGIYSCLGDYETAVRKNTAALQVLWSQGALLSGACQIYTQTAEAMADAGHPESALAYQLESLAYCTADANKILAVASHARAGFYYAQVGKQREAISFFNKAIAWVGEYRDKNGLGILLPDLYTSLGNAYVQQGELEKAEAAYRTVLGKLDDRQMYNLAALHHGLALIHLRQGKFELAEKELRDSLALIEESRQNLSGGLLRGTFVNNKSQVYRSMVQFQYIRKQAFEQAFEFAEKYRSSELFESLDKGAGARRELSENVLAASNVSATLSLGQVQQALPGNVQLVHYAVTENNLLAWIITSEGWTTVRTPVIATRLQQMTAEYEQKIVEGAELSELKQIAMDLYRILIEPIKSRLDQKRELFLIPDLCLNALPFAALVDPGSERYLIQDYALTVNPSAGVTIKALAAGRSKRRSGSESLLSLSNPRFDARLFPALKPLPRTIDEAAAVGSFYPNRMGLSQERATKSALLKLMGDYEVVHLATHSVVNEQNPLLSAIILAKEDASTGDRSDELQLDGNDRLQAKEIFQLRLARTRLVVLSSCRSISQASLHDKGLGGLAHSFLSAGAPTVVASLWAVDDGSTAALMMEFHRAHRVEQRSFSQALRQAQIAMLTSANALWRRPYYWAAFIVSGDGIAA